MDQLRILIEGVGGVGGVIAGELIERGMTPTLVTGNAEITSIIRDRGLRVRTPERRFTAPAEAVVTSLVDLAGAGAAPFDVALLIMKATAVVEAAEATVPLLHPDTGHVVTMQNGIVEDAVAEVVGRPRVVSAIIGWGGTMHGPGDVERTSVGDIHVGELDGGLSDRVERLSRVLDHVTPVVVSDNILGALWTKLAINCTITTLGALTGETLGQMLANRPMRRVFLGVASEVIDTAEALGVRLERVRANPRMLYLPRDAGVVTRLTKDLVLRFVGRKYGKLTSSMLQSLQRGRPTEIDYLNGYVVEQAATAGVDTPLNTAVVRLIKEIERGERPLSPDNTRELLALIP